jgi:hypothetical protein
LRHLLEFTEFCIVTTWDQLIPSNQLLFSLRYTILLPCHKTPLPGMEAQTRMGFRSSINIAAEEREHDKENLILAAGQEVQTEGKSNIQLSLERWNCCASVNGLKIATNKMDVLDLAHVENVFGGTDANATIVDGDEKQLLEAAILDEKSDDTDSDIDGE